MKYLPLLLLLSLFVSILHAQTTQHVWLLGNTADVPAESPYWPQLRQALEEAPKPVYLLIAGDIVPDCEEGNPPEAPIRTLLNLVQGLPEVRMGILPGDRDWADSGPQGWECVKNMENYVLKNAPENVEWLIDDGCPGPDMVEIAPNLLLVALNTQWWNHPYRKPIPADAVCDEIVKGAVYEEIEDAIKENRERNVILAGHFPPFSLGKYGGRYPLSAHLLPPVIGGIRVAYHEHVGGPRDITNARFEELQMRLLYLGTEYENLAFLSGHEPNQQVITYRSNSLLNSGAPLSAGYVSKSPIGRLLRAEPGLLRMAYHPQGKVTYQFLRYTGQGFSPEKEELLYQSPCGPEEAGIPVNQVRVPCALPEEAAVTETPPITTDSVTTAAGPQYAAGPIHKLFFGPHYRATWTTPLQVPLLHIDTAYGGLEILEKGGGRQTQSLKMRNPAGLHYVFRSVDKDPVRALSRPLRKTIAASITRDQTSSQHPYGALVVAPMLEELNILHASPRLFVMPNHPRLGQFRPSFADMLGMVEERPTNDGHTEQAFGGADDIYKSYDLFHEMYDHPTVQLDAPEFARARMFDILVGDWSKHEDNWKWAVFEKNEGRWVRPIPRDRDHAFSNLDGLIPWLASRKWGIPNLEHFDYKVNSVRKLTYQARHMDRFLGNELARKDWLQAAREVQQGLPQEKIRKAVWEMPAKAYEVSGKEIEAKLLQRREDLEACAGKFYDLLARYVDIPGSNKLESFYLKRQADGSSLVEVRRLEDSSLLYRRTFLPGETEEIRLYGLNGDDHFLVEGEAETAIKARIVGGPGADRITDRSSVRKGRKTTFIYEKEAAELSLGSEARQMQRWNDELYYYDRTAFRYNSYLPLLYASFNTFNGLMLKGGVSFTRHNFNKREYSAKHDLGFGIGTLGNFTLTYEGEIHHAFRKWDVLFHGAFARPDDFNFFFGIGDGTTYDEERFRNDYYLVRHNRIEGRAGLQRQFWKRSYARLMLGFSRNDVPVEDNTILADTEGLFGTGQLNIFNEELAVEVDLRDHETFPTRGYRFYAAQEAGLIDGDSYALFDTYLEYFLSHPLYPLTLGLKAGYGTSFGEVPFYKLPQLGQNQGLRGFQRNRFAGDSRVYFNSEIRIPIVEVQTAILPLDIGLRGFFDLGKILEDEDEEQKWQLGYGGGFYIIPLSRAYTLSVLAGVSREETAVISVELGTNF